MWKRIAIAGVVLIAALLILLETRAFQQWLLQRAENYARTAGVPFTAGNLDLNLWDLQGTLQDVVYEDAGTRITADRVSIDVPWDGFSGDVIVINDLEIDGLVIEIQSAEPVIPEPAGEASQPSDLPRLQFDRLVVRNGSFSYKNQTTEFQIPQFALDLQNGRGSLLVPEPISMPPDLSVQIREIPVVMATDGLQFGPTAWDVSYTEYNGRGSAQGRLQWSPAVSVDLTFTTEPLTFDQWKDISATGNVAFADGVLKITDFRARQGDGQLTASAEISDQRKSASAVWAGLRLDPAGFPAATEGTLQLAWQASDFSDASGEGSVTIISPEYGRVQSDIRIANARANLNIAANAFDAAIRANVTTGLDQTLSGSFQVTHRQYGQIAVNGTLGGTLTQPLVNGTLQARNVMYNDIGPVDATARATLRDNVVSVTGITANLKQSHLDNGALRVNLESRRIDGEVPAISLNLQDFVMDGSGLVTASATVAGTIDRPSAEFTAASDGLDAGGTHIDTVALSGRFIDNVVYVDQLHAMQAEGQLDAQGSFNLQTEAVLADVDVQNLHIVSLQGLSTTVFLNGTIGGTPRAPTTEFQGRLVDVVYEGQMHGNVTLEGRMASDTAIIHAESDKYTATADSDITLGPPYAFNATVTTNQTQIQYQQYNFAANGRTLASGQAQPFEIRRIGFEDFTVRGEGIEMAASGAMSAADPGVNLTINADLAQVPVEGTTLTGTAQVQALVRGTLENIQVDGSIETENATVALAGMPEPVAVEANIDFTRDEFRIRDMSAEVAEGVATITGGGTLKGTGEFQFKATNIRPERFLKDPSVTGIISAEGSATLTEPSLAGLSAAVQVSQLDLTVRDIVVRQAEPIRVSIAREVLTVDSFKLAGLDTNAVVEGSANLQTGALDLMVEADTDLRILEALVPGSIAIGRLQTQVSIAGTTQNPNLNGFVSLDGAEFQMASPPIILRELNARVQLQADRVEIVQAAANLNGGQIMASGGIGISSTGLRDAAIQIEATGVQMEYPEGLQSEINSTLTVAVAGTALEIQGTVDIVSALYQEDISLSQEVLSRVTNANTGRSGIAGADTEPGSLEQIALNVIVRTPGPVTVSNNLANLDLSGDFRVLGTIAEPILLGRAAVNEGGELYFGPGIGSDTTIERRDRFVIERGVIDFNNPIRTEPNFDFLATHELDLPEARHLITLEVTGTPATLKTELSADDPNIRESDIVLMLLTRRTYTELQGAYLDVAQEQIASYLSGRVSGFFDTAGSALGLDTVRIDPVALASEEDVSARLTVGKDITSNFNLAYSQNLKGTRSQTWIATYDAYKDLMVRAINESDKRQVRVELRHDLRFGGGPALPRRVEPWSELLLGTVTIKGTSVPSKELTDKVTKPGKPYNSYRMNEDARKLRSYFNDRDYLEVRIRTLLYPPVPDVDVDFIIEQGPKITFTFQGADVPKRIQAEIRQIWINGFADVSSLRASRDTLLRYFRDEGYLQVAVTHGDAQTDPLVRPYVFEIQPGRKYADPEWVIDGIESVDIPESAGTILENPEALRNRIQFELQDKGFLSATASVPELIIEGEKARFEIHVDPGPPFLVNDLVFEGNQFFTAAQLIPVVKFGPTPVPALNESRRDSSDEGALDMFPFTSQWIETGQQRLTSEYLHQGFNDIQIRPTTSWDNDTARVSIKFSISEGERQLINDIKITGADLTSPSYVTRQFVFKPGEPVDYSRLNLTRKKLYDTRLFKKVEIEMVPNGTGYAADVRLNETAPWRVRYGMAVTNRLETSDRELGVTGDISYGNLFGRGITLGLSLKGHRTERDGRIFGSFPVFLNRDVQTTVTLFRTRDFAIEDITQDFTGFTLQQQWRFRNNYILSYDYGYKRIHQFEPAPDPDNPLPIDLLFSIGRFNGSLTRDSRNDVLDATRGTFLSNSFEIAPPGIGSDFKFLKNYTQYLRFQPVSSNMVWASAVRLGVLKGLGGQFTIPSEQFTTGGSTSIRGFKQDDPVFGQGNSLLVVNQEIRFPLFWRFGGVAFVDAGNVYPSVGGLKSLDLRYSPGVGLRVNTPFALLRADVGWNPFAREGEISRRFVFGIGQAF